LEEELLGPGRNFRRRDSVSTEIGWKEIFFFQKSRFEGELLFPGRTFGRRASVSTEIGRKEIFFPGRKFGRRASVSRKEVWNESNC
jgi:hypothetical protein